MIETIMTVLCTGALVILFAALIVCIIMLIRCEVTYKHHITICEAIYDYHGHLIEEGQFDINNLPVTYEDMEDLDTTLYRIWDWGYTRILPPEKFELIKPFIKREKEN